MPRHFGPVPAGSGNNDFRVIRPSRYRKAAWLPRVTVDSPPNRADLFSTLTTPGTLWLLLDSRTSSQGQPIIQSNMDALFVETAL
jgi:hypothetical protein